MRDKQLFINLLSAMSNIQTFQKLILNDHNKKIMDLISKRKMTMTDVSKFMSISKKSTHLRVKKLETYGFIESKLIEHSRGNQ